jgi:hypothetical protein
MQARLLICFRQKARPDSGTWAREEKACAGLAGRDTAYAEGAADFGCLVGGGSKAIPKDLRLEGAYTAALLNTRHR